MKERAEFDVFVSRPTRVLAQFQQGLTAFLTRLTDQGLRPRTLGATDYGSKGPLDEVIRLLDDCHGCVILGYPQIEVTAGTLKGEPLARQLVLATEWNHIEAGLAYARGLPLLVVHHVGVSRGIFDRGTVNSFIYERDLTDMTWPYQEDLAGALARWRDDVLTGRPLRGGNAAVAKEPACPNCSTGGRTVYMSRLPSDFVDAFNATHRCTRCDYTTTA